MRSCRSEIERLLPTLRQVARALVDKHRVDVADDLVHEAVDEAIRCERIWAASEIETRLFTRVIGSNRLRVRAEMDERRSLPGVSARGDGSASRAALSDRDSGEGLDRLNLGDREVLLLVVLGRLDYAKVAEIVGVPIGTLIARLTHARDTLGTSLWSSPTVSPKPKLGVTSGHLRLVKS